MKTKEIDKLKKTTYKQLHKELKAKVKKILDKSQYSEYGWGDLEHDLENILSILK